MLETSRFEWKYFLGWIPSSVVVALVIANGNRQVEFAYVAALTIGVLLWSGIILALTRTSRQPEIMWWIYPIVASFIATWWIIKFILAGAFGIRFPEPSSTHSSPRRPTPNKKVNQWIDQQSEKTGKQFLEENQNFKPQNKKEEEVFQEIVSNPQKTLDEIISEMSEEEYEAFIAMLLRLLGITIL